MPKTALLARLKFVKLVFRKIWQLTHSFFLISSFNSDSTKILAFWWEDLRHHCLKFQAKTPFFLTSTFSQASLLRWEKKHVSLSKTQATMAHTFCQLFTCFTLSIKIRKFLNVSGRSMISCPILLKKGLFLLLDTFGRSWIKKNQEQKQPKKKGTRKKILKKPWWCPFWSFFWFMLQKKKDQSHEAEIRICRMWD